MLSRREIFIDIPDHVSFRQIWGPKSFHIKKVETRFNAKNTNERYPGHRFAPHDTTRTIKFILIEDYITSIKQYYKEFFDKCKSALRIPNYVPVEIIIGKNGQNINSVQTRFNAIIIIKKKYKNNVYLPGNVIEISNNEQNLDEIKQYYKEIFDRYSRPRILEVS